MKIIQLIQKPQLRGAELFACQLSNELLAEGHEVQVISLFPGDATLPFKGNLIRLDCTQSNRFVDLKGWRQLASIIKQHQPDVVQANAGDTLKYAVISKLLFRWKTPIVFRNASTISSYIKSAGMKFFNRFLFKQVHHVVSVSEYSRKDFLKLFPWVQSKISVVPIGIDVSTELPYIRESSYILHVGGFTFEKNHEGLLHIFQSLLKERPELQLWLAGDGLLRLHIEGKIKTMALQNQVRFLGYQNNVMALMASASVVVLPSSIEGLPGVILEAMFSKTPVVAYDVGGISEVIINKETGWLVKAGDEDGFVRAVQEVLQMKSEDLGVITDRAFNKVVSEFDNKVIAKRFLEVYSSIVNGQLTMNN